MKHTDILAALAVAALWGLNFPAIKMAVGEMPPLFMSGLRFGAVFALLVWFAPLPRGRFKAIAVLSVVFGFVHFGLLSVAMTRVDAAAGAILMQLNVPFAAVLASVFLGDGFGVRRWIGVAVAFVGVAVLAGEPRASEAPAFLGLVLMSAFGWGVGQVMVKRMPGVNPFAVNAWLSGFLAPQLLVASWVLESGQVDAAMAAGAWGWGGVLYQVVGASVLAYGLWYYLLGRHEVSKVVPFNLLVPVFGVLGGVLVLGEALTVEKLIGGTITLLGVALVQIRFRRRRG